jgi:hypothetical protein
MLTFEQFLSDAAQRGEAVNTLFEERLFDLVGVLRKITGALTAEGVPHELIGGLAVLIHVEEADPAQTMLTRDVDLLVRRVDLDRIKEAGAKQGFRFRHAAGVDRLLHGPTDSARNSVHLIFGGEKVRPNQMAPNPPISPEMKRTHGKEFMVVPLIDLLRMKLSAFRLKDQVHVQAMDAAGLITEEVEKKLSDDLLSRLKHIRETE